MEHVDAIKKGNEDLDGLVEEEPDRVMRMQVAADVDPQSSEPEEQLE
jgi:hypothetical protein